jgi:hypothetical protein
MLSKEPTDDAFIKRHQWSEGRTRLTQAFFAKDSVDKVVPFCGNTGSNPLGDANK